MSKKEIEDIDNRISKIELGFKDLKNNYLDFKNEKTIISLKEYYELINNLKEYKEIRELKPIAEMMEREINKLTVWA